MKSFQLLARTRYVETDNLHVITYIATDNVLKLWFKAPQKCLYSGLSNDLKVPGVRIILHRNYSIQSDTEILIHRFPPFVSLKYIEQRISNCCDTLGSFIRSLIDGNKMDLDSGKFIREFEKTLICGHWKHEDKLAMIKISNQLGWLYIDELSIFDLYVTQLYFPFLNPAFCVTQAIVHEKWDIFYYLLPHLNPNYLLGKVMIHDWLFFDLIDLGAKIDEELIGGLHPGVSRRISYYIIAEVFYPLTQAERDQMLQNVLEYEEGFIQYGNNNCLDILCEWGTADWNKVALNAYTLAEIQILHVHGANDWDRIANHFCDANIRGDAELIFLYAIEQGIQNWFTLTQTVVLDGSLFHLRTCLALGNVDLPLLYDTLIQDYPKAEWEDYAMDDTMGWIECLLNGDDQEAFLDALERD